MKHVVTCITYRLELNMLHSVFISVVLTQAQVWPVLDMKNMMDNSRSCYSSLVLSALLALVVKLSQYLGTLVTEIRRVVEPVYLSVLDKLRYFLLPVMMLFHGILTFQYKIKKELFQLLTGAMILIICNTTIA